MYRENEKKVETGLTIERRQRRKLCKGNFETWEHTIIFGNYENEEEIANKARKRN